MNRRSLLHVAVVLAGASPLLAYAVGPRITSAEQLDVGVSVGNSGDVLRLPALLQRRGMLLVIDGSSNSDAAWLEKEMRRIPSEVFEELLVLLVDPVSDAERPPAFDATRYAGLRVCRSTAAEWRRVTPATVLPQIFGFADGGRLRLQRMGNGAQQLGLVQFHGALIKEIGGRP